MWQLKSPTKKIAKLDFSGSGQSKITITQLYENDTKLINGIELVNWGQKDLQFIVCEVCGFAGCQLHNWVTFKRAGDIVLIIPAFKAIQEEETRYFPPCAVMALGAVSPTIQRITSI